MTRQLYDGYGVHYGGYYKSPPIQTQPFRRGTLPGAAGAAANQQIFFKHQTRKSPRKSPRRSPRKSPRRSPRKSPRRSPRKYSKKVQFFLQNAEQMGVDPEYVKRFR